MNAPERIDLVRHQRVPDIHDLVGIIRIQCQVIITEPPEPLNIDRLLMPLIEPWQIPSHVELGNGLALIHPLAHTHVHSINVKVMIDLVNHLEQSDVREARLRL